MAYEDEDRARKAAQNVAAKANYKPPRMLQADEPFCDPNVDYNITNLWKEKPKIKDADKRFDNDQHERSIVELAPDPIVSTFMSIYSKNKMQRGLREEKEQYSDSNDWKMRAELEKEANEYGMGKGFIDTYRFRNDDRALKSYRDNARMRISPKGKK